ncbi:DUF6765 family protein [Undibacterium sp.]|jgi:hypothetical protein|uniref:DUF6765 family protein n=1 Tax=Undibacterium sp. TaxID=1914977 RepID=UPI002C9F998C|nr:DUF6765 family protein [Undibacterium sp.]HTD03864.1 DUF6765 family protein [Undibacterium sp.]
MQIDFHHGVTYLIARLAGFDFDEADIIAHSAQYVDDATNKGEIWFDNGMLYERIASAHKMLDYSNMQMLSNHRVWLPFHFLPGNSNEPKPDSPPSLDAEAFAQRCVCRPNSAPARELMRSVIERQARRYALYRLGIAAHVFADTWAHQGFVGFESKLNIARKLQAENDTHHAQSFGEKAFALFGLNWDETVQGLVGAMLPLGHGSVLSYPDRPYLKWRYENAFGQTVVRDNPRDFAEAAAELFQWFCRYRDYAAAPSAALDKTYPLPPQWDKLVQNLGDITDEDPDARHVRWLDMARDGTFGFHEPVDYLESGVGSWKEMALGTEEDVNDNGDDKLPLPPQFHNSHWKLFHDGLQAHRFYVLHELLPEYGILSS